MKKNIQHVLLFWAALLMLSDMGRPETDIKTLNLYIGSEKFFVEIADTPKKRELGLMYREYIPDDFGMLFVFENEGYRSFWMKNCKVSLDIIYLDENKQIVSLYRDVPPCKSEPCPSYGSKKPAMYVLELRANRSKELNLQPGDTISFILQQ